MSKAYCSSTVVLNSSLIVLKFLFNSFHFPSILSTKKLWGITKLIFSFPCIICCLLCQQADPSSLKTFLSLLKLGDKALENVNLSCLVPAKISEIEKPKTEMVIKRRADYPLGKPFPSKLDKLTVNNCGIVRIEARILQMKSLSCLNVAENQVRAIPCRLASFSTLSKLILHGNRIREFPSSLCSGSLASSLKLLDLSQNEIKLLPVTFCNLKNLVHLKLDKNSLHMLPINTGSLSHLRFLSASHNQLKVLPYSLSKLKLDSIDVSANPFLAQDKWYNISKLAVPSLKECAGIAVKKRKWVLLTSDFEISLRISCYFYYMER